jgi:hypothetical protein
MQVYAGNTLKMKELRGSFLINPGNLNPRVEHLNYPERLTQ